MESADAKKVIQESIGKTKKAKSGFWDNYNSDVGSKKIKMSQNVILSNIGN